MGNEMTANTNTPGVPPDERAKFEKWARDNVGGFSRNGHHGRNGVWVYSHNILQGYWSAWQAWAAAEVVGQQLAGWKLVPENADEPMQKAMQRAVLLRKSMNDVWRAALAESPVPPSLPQSKPQAAGAATAEPLTECHDNDSPWLVCKPCFAAGQCKQACSAGAAPDGEVAALLADAKAIIEWYAEKNPKWRGILGGTQDPLGAHAWLEKFAALSPANSKGGAAVPAALNATPSAGQGNEGVPSDEGAVVPMPSIERQALARLFPMIERGMKDFVFTADKAGEVQADLSTLREFVAYGPKEEA